MPRPRLASIGACLLALISTSCLGSRGGELEQLDPAAFRDLPRLPSASYEVQIALRKGGSGGMGRVPLSSELEPLFRRTFSGTRRGHKGEEPLHIDLYFKQQVRNHTRSFCMGLLFVSTLGLFPAYETVDFELDALVVWKDEVLLHRVYRDHTSNWYHLFVLPFAVGRDVESINQATVQNILLHMVKDVREELTR